MHGSRSRTVVLFLGLAVVFLSTAPGAGEPLDLRRTTVVFDLVDASLEISYDAGAPPRVDLAPGSLPETLGEAVVATDSGGRIVVRDRPETRADRPPLHLRAVLRPEQRLEIHGSDLEVLVSATSILEDLATRSNPGYDDEDEKDEEEDEGPVRGVAEPRIDVSSSTVRMMNLVSEMIVVVATDSMVFVEGGLSRLDMTVMGGSLGLTHNRGPADLNIEGAEATIAEHTGGLTIEADEGSAYVSGGRGQITATFTGGSLTSQDWTGSLRLESTNCSASIHNQQRGSIILEARDSFISIGGGSGRVQAGTTRGSIDVADFNGAVQVVAQNDATFEAREIEGSLNATVTSGSTAKVEKIAGDVTATIGDAEFSLDGCQGLKLTAARATVNLARAGRVTQLELDGCEADLDFTEESDRVQHLTTFNASVVRVHLPSPCEVRTKTTNDGFTNFVSVSGCEFRLPNQPRSRSQGRSRLSTESIAILHLQTDDISEVEIYGD